MRTLTYVCSKHDQAHVWMLNITRAVIGLEVVIETWVLRAFFQIFADIREIHIKESAKFKLLVYTYCDPEIIEINLDAEPCRSDSSQ